MSKELKETYGALAAKMQAATDARESAPSPQAQGGEAVGWGIFTPSGYLETSALTEECARKEAARFDEGWTVNPLYATPQRAPGVDEAMVERAWIAVGGDRELRASDRDASRRYVERVLEAALAAPVSAGDGEALDPSLWAVEVLIQGRRVLTIGHDALSGIHDIDQYADVVRKCGEHLLAFIGPDPALTSGASGVES